eukprot:CAMPEP_0179466294 /NCGR_PEP_ID=MMETSP0799-20121207/47633_1 /TAXON_ID=46947 /ORGANISM="Geminigera cryophila, Strain CCMP2564" /LENGTH=31 /DNA_ID= /DNA_START= /DNA_END= /DNA_ORIENTATION=
MQNAFMLGVGYCAAAALKDQKRAKKMKHDAK